MPTCSPSAASCCSVGGSGSYGQPRLFLIGSRCHGRLDRMRTRGLTGVPDRRTAVQGLGGAIVSAVSLSLMMSLFTEPAERAKAMGVFASSRRARQHRRAARRRSHRCARLALDLPRQRAIGIGVYVASLRLLPTPAAARRSSGSTWRGVTITAALMLAVYAIVTATTPAGRRRRRSASSRLQPSPRAFLVIESRVRSPLVPLGCSSYGTWRRRTSSASSGPRHVAWFFSRALPAARARYSPLQVGLAFLPANLIMGAFSIGSRRSS